MSKQIRVWISDEANAALEVECKQRDLPPATVVSAAILHLLKPEESAETDSKIDALLGQWAAFRAECLEMFDQLLAAKDTPMTAGAMQRWLEQIPTCAVPVETPAQVKQEPVPHKPHRLAQFFMKG